MHVTLDQLDDRPITWLCQRLGSSRFAAIATTALGAGMALGAVGGAAASACVAVAMLVTADRAYGLATRRQDRAGGNPLTAPLATLMEALRGEKADGFWLVRHAGGATEGMTPSSFERFSRGLAERMQRVLMIFPDREPATNFDGLGQGRIPGLLARRVRLQDAASKPRAVDAQGLMDCLIQVAYDDVHLVEGAAKVDPATGILSQAALPAEGPGPMTEAYLAFGDGRRYMLDRLADGRHFVADMQAFGADLQDTGPAMA